MVELLFDNTHAFLRSKKIHVRLGILDEMEIEENSENAIEQEIEGEMGAESQVEKIEATLETGMENESGDRHGEHVEVEKK